MNNIVFDFLAKNKRYKGYYNQVTLLRSIEEYADDLEIEVRGLNLVQLHLKYSDLYVLLPTSTTGIALINNFHCKLTGLIFDEQHRELGLRYLTTNIQDAQIINNYGHHSYYGYDWASKLVFENPHLEGRFYSMYEGCIFYYKPREGVRLSKKIIYENRIIYRDVKKYLSSLSKKYFLKNLDFSDFIFFRGTVYLFEGLHSLYSNNIEKKEITCCTKPDLIEFTLDELLSTSEQDHAFYYKCKNCGDIINIKEIYNFNS